MTPPTRHMHWTAGFRPGFISHVAGPPPVMCMFGNSVMSDSEAEQVPKTQAAASGSPPRPPKKTARGLEDGSPDPGLTKLDFVEAKIRLAERLIRVASKQLLYPGLSAAKRAKLRELLREMRDDKRRFQDQKRALQNQERNAGTLRVKGALGNTVVTVNSGAAFGGSGTVLGPVKVQSGATFAPGASIGTLTISNNLVLAACNTNVFEANLDTLACDQVVGLNKVTYAGTLNMVLSGRPALASETFKLFSAPTARTSYSSPYRDRKRRTWSS